MLFRTLLLIALAAPALARDWQKLDHDAIGKALSARLVQYEDGSTQNFYTDGRTLYQVDTGTSWGKWWVEGALYCSTWPPSETKSCYSVEAKGIEIRFVSSGGAVTAGRYLDP